MSLLYIIDDASFIEEPPRQTVDDERLDHSSECSYDVLDRVAA